MHPPFVFGSSFQSTTAVVARPPLFYGVAKPSLKVHESGEPSRWSHVAVQGSRIWAPLRRLLLSAPGHLWSMHSLISPVTWSHPGCFARMHPSHTLAHRFALPGVYIFHLVAPSPSLWQVQSPNSLRFHDLSPSLTIKQSRPLYFPIQHLFSTVSAALQSSSLPSRKQIPSAHSSWVHIAYPHLPPRSPSLAPPGKARAVPSLQSRRDESLSELAVPHITITTILPT